MNDELKRKRDFIYDRLQKCGRSMNFSVFVANSEEHDEAFNNRVLKLLSSFTDAFEKAKKDNCYVVAKANFSFGGAICLIVMERGSDKELFRFFVKLEEIIPASDNEQMELSL